MATKPPKKNPQTPGTKYRDVGGVIRTYNAPKVTSPSKPNSLTASGYGPIYDALNSGISAFTPPATLFQPQPSTNFTEQATAEVAPYYDKQLSMALEQLNLAKAQATELKTQSEQQQQQNMNQWRKSEDFNFMNALKSAQNGYAGRGTLMSGISYGGIQNLQTNEQTNIVDPYNLQQQQATQTRNTGFSQFLAQNDLSNEQTRTKNEIDRNNAIQQNMRAIQSEEQTKQKYGVNALGQAFSQFLGNNQRLSA